MEIKSIPGPIPSAELTFLLAETLRAVYLELPLALLSKIGTVEKPGDTVCKIPLGLVVPIPILPPFSINNLVNPFVLKPIGK